MKYREFNLDLSRMLKEGIREQGLSVTQLSAILGFSESRLLEITENPMLASGCDFGAVVMHLNLVNEFYEALFREMARDRTLTWH